MHNASTRSSFKYVSYKDLREFSKDFKSLYKTINEETALDNLTKLEEKWGKKYHYALKSWEMN